MVSSAPEPANAFVERLYALLVAGQYATAVSAVTKRDLRVYNVAKQDFVHHANRAEKVLEEIANLAHPWNTECDC